MSEREKSADVTHNHTQSTRNAQINTHINQSNTTLKKDKSIDKPINVDDQRLQGREMTMTYDV